MAERLVELARGRIASGALPASVPERTFGGISAGGQCAVCEAAIPSKTLEIEVASSQGAFVMHPTCFAAWSSAAHERVAKCATSE